MANLQRVFNLTLTYDFMCKMMEENDGVHLKTETLDMLRSAVVLLHASLEDFLRSLAKIFFPYDDAKEFENIPMPGDNKVNPGKYTLGAFVAYRDVTINQLLEDSVDQWLNKQSFNNCSDVMSMLSKINIETKPVQEFMSKINEMMQRRHRIVHYADRHENASDCLNDITKEQVLDWRENVNKFMRACLIQLKDRANYLSDK